MTEHLVLCKICQSRHRLGYCPAFEAKSLKSSISTPQQASKDRSPKPQQGKAAPPSNPQALQPKEAPLSNALSNSQGLERIKPTGARGGDYIRVARWRKKHPAEYRAIQRELMRKARAKAKGG